MREDALKFVRLTVDRYKKHMVTPMKDIADPIGAKRYHQEVQSLLMWETILEMMNESEVPTSFPVYGTSPIMEAMPMVILDNDVRRIELLNGHIDVPRFLIDSAQHIADWFDENNIENWKLGGIQKRNDK